eukprot:Hpha_TRINITY_DN4148_c0_g1::TRINITY_DN4148_c0_g1_i1::g.194829::m.194829
MSSDAAVPGQSGFAKVEQNRYAVYETQLIPGRLFLTSHYEAFDPDFLAEHRIRVALNVMHESDWCPFPDALRESCPSVEFVHRPMKESCFSGLEVLGKSDGGEEAGKEMMQLLDEAWKGSVDNGGALLLHCREGRNRSASILIGWMMKSRTDVATHFGLQRWEELFSHSNAPASSPPRSRSRGRAG